MTYLQAVVIGLLQGVTELFPVSSLGHSVLLPALIGGGWTHLVTDVSSAESPYLAFIVGLHVATALALLVFDRRDWATIIAAFLTTLRTRRAETSAQRLAWLIVLATIPVGLTGLIFEHQLRTIFAKPLAAAIFLTLNGILLLAGELAAYLSVRFLTRWFHTRTLTPFGIYCLLAGTLCIAWFA